VKINPSHPSEQARPSPSEERGRAAPDRQAVSLTPGQLFKGRVLRVEPNGRVVLAVNEELVTARTPLKLAEGSEHWLEVRRGGAEPWLALAGRKGAAGELLRLLAAEESGRGKALELLLAGGDREQLPAAASSLLQGVAGLLAESAAGGEADPARIILAFLLLRSPSDKKEEGGFLRRRLADLLTVLPKEAAARKGGEKLDRILAAMEEMNGQPAAAADRFFLCPCLLAGGAGWGEWLFTPDDPGETAGEAGYQLSFFLRLSRLGELHLQLTVRGEAVLGTIAAASVEARQHLEASLEELTGLLQRLGFERVHLACRLAERHLLQELQETLRRRIGLAPLALVDLRT
jgi:hypothetical protein